MAPRHILEAREFAREIPLPENGWILYGRALTIRRRTLGAPGCYRFQCPVTAGAERFGLDHRALAAAAAQLEIHQTHLRALVAASDNLLGCDLEIRQTLLDRCALDPSEGETPLEWHPIS